MTTQFYRDLRNAQVERLAKAICTKDGLDPESLVKDNGYSDSPMIPRWWKYQGDAFKFLAMMEEFNRPEPTISPGLDSAIQKELDHPPAPIMEEGK